MLFHKKCKIFTAAGVAEVIASHISFFFFTMVLTMIWASLVAQLVKNPPVMWETWV